MNEIIIDPKVLTKLPKCRLGVLAGSVKSFKAEGLNSLLDSIERNKEYHDRHTDIIEETKLAYKALGKDPARYRPSAEALRKRIKAGKSIYRINNLVDCINAISIISSYSIGAFDVLQIEGEIKLSIGGPEPYRAIGRGILNIEYLPCLIDKEGPFGTPTSDSERTCLKDSTTEILLVIYDFYSNTGFNKTMNLASEMLQKYCNFRPIT